MNGFERLVQYYRAEYQPEAAEELDIFRRQPSLPQAIYLAGQAMDDNCRRFNHQFRLTKEALNNATAALTASTAAIERCNDFEQLITLIEDLVGEITRIGELYIYDTALRIGAKRGIEPELVYLHAGTREGAKALGFDGNRKSIHRSELPTALQSLRPREIEDLLCIYKEDLKRLAQGASLPEIAAAPVCRYGRPRKSRRKC